MSLQKIQKQLKAPKNQYNEFGKYKYRNQEDILEALKPVLAEYEYSIVISDSVEQVADRIYIKAEAVIYGPDLSVIAKNSAYAREPAEKKGMDSAQVTGATSSYARKYALNGLLAIDDTKDADSQKPENGKQENKYINGQQVSQIVDMINQYGVDETKFLQFMGVDSVEHIAIKDFNKAMSALKKKAGAA